MHWTEWFWVSWAVVGIVADIIFKLKNEQWTLSRYAKAWFALLPELKGSRAWQLRRLAILFFLSYISFHWLLNWV